MTQLDLVRSAYSALVQLPLGGAMRLRMQGVLATLRDEIATATGQSAEDVQNEFESWAAHIRPAKTHTEGGQ